MTNERPLLLLSNDDGVNAKGIQELIAALRTVADLIVVAPDGPRSGSSGAITSERPLRCTKMRQEPGLIVYKCSGSPVDCVKLALHALVPRKPDMVIGGINHGDNSSVNVHYSGTMGVVIEGCLKGIPSVGFSLCNHSADADFSATLPYVRRIVEEVLTKGGLDGDGGVLGDGVAGNHLVVCGGLGEADVDIAHGEGVLHLGGPIGQPSQRAADDTGHQQGQSQNQRQNFLFHTRFFLSYKL